MNSVSKYPIYPKFLVMLFDMIDSILQIPL